MIFSGYTTFEMIAEIAFTASVPLILLFAFTEIMQQVNSERKEVDKYIRWERIQVVVAILFLVDFICLIGFIVICQIFSSNLKNGYQNGSRILKMTFYIGILKAKAEQKKQGQIFAGKLNQIILNL